MRAAVIGSGPAAVAVLTALKDLNACSEISVFDPGGSLDPASDRPPSELYPALRRSYGMMFPPPKTHDAQVPGKWDIDGTPRAWQARHLGGLSPFWGAFVLPYRDADMKAWPIALEDLDPGYRRMANLMGISGTRDALNALFPETYENRPPISLSKATARLISACNAEPLFVAGRPRLAIETRTEARDSCVRCGRCMTGCPSGAIYDVRRDFSELTSSDAGVTLIADKVVRIVANARKLLSSNGAEYGPFDKIFVAAGCLGTAELIARSYDLAAPLTITDNTIFTFPIVVTSGADRALGDDHMAATQAVLAFTPEDGTPMLKIQVYESFDYLWQYYVPPALWGLFRPLGRSLRRRVLLARLYLDGSSADQYALTISDDGRPILRQSRHARAAPHVTAAKHALALALKGHGFWVPPVKPVQHRTSSHYTGALPYGRDFPTRTGTIRIDRRGNVSEGIHICDGAVFPEAPSNAPTLTIMANAYRTVTEAVRG